MKGNRKGFTLVELIIVIAVIGVLAAILIPVFSNVIEKANAKSALSDAKNVITGLTAQMQGDEVTKLPDLLVAVHKGSHLYIYAYTQNADELMECNSNPFKYNKKASVRSNAVPVLSELEKEAIITLNPETIAFTDAYVSSYLKKAGYNAKDITAYTEYIIDVDGFRAIEKLNISQAVPDDPPEPEPVVIKPEYDAANEVYVYTVTTDDADMLALSEDNRIELDISPITAELAQKVSENGGSRWYGYGIRIVNKTALNLSKLTLETSSEKLTNIMNGTTQLTEDMYPYITAGKAFTEYMTSIGYSAVNETTVNDYISKVNAGTLSKTYKQYLTETYGDKIPVDKISEVCGGNNVGELRHAEKDVAKLIFDCMYSNGFAYSFLSAYNAAAFSDYRNSLDNLEMKDGWKTSGSIKYYSVYDLLSKKNMSDIDFTRASNTEGAIMLSWNKNAVPEGSAFIQPEMKLYIAPSD